MTSPHGDDRRTCPRCGRPLPPHAADCPCGYSRQDEHDDREAFEAAIEQETRDEEEPADDAFLAEVEEGPGEEIDYSGVPGPDEQEFPDQGAEPETPDTGAGPRGAAPQPRHRLFRALTLIILAATLIIVGYVVYAKVIVSRANRHGEPAENRGADPAAVPPGYEYVTLSRSPERPVEAVLAAADLQSALDTLSKRGDRIAVILRKDTAWSMPDRRRAIEEDAVAVPRLLFREFPEANRIRVEAVSVFGEGTASESVTAFEVEVSRARFGETENKDARARLEQWGARYDPRLLAEE